MTLILASILIAAMGAMATAAIFSFTSVAESLIGVREELALSRSPRTVTVPRMENLNDEADLVYVVVQPGEMRTNGRAEALIAPVPERRNAHSPEELVSALREIADMVERDGAWFRIVDFDPRGTDDLDPSERAV